MAYSVTELTADERGNLGISNEEGTAEVTYIIEGPNETTGPTADDLDDFATRVNGGVGNIEPKVLTAGTYGAGKIVRTLPAVHPMRPELSASGIVSLTGFSECHTTTSAVGVLGLTPATAAYPAYTQYKSRVKFVKRPYFLLPDAKIPVRTDLYYYGPNGESPVNIVAAEEWRRFVTVTRTPTGDNATATYGEMVARTQSGTTPPTGREGVQFNGSSVMYLQNELVELTWWMVPYRYLLDFTFDDAVYKSYLTRFVGTVNQSPISFGGMTFREGSLLYLGCTPVTTYIPVTPKRQKLFGYLGVGLDQGLLCNLKLRFLYTSREGTDVPSSGNPYFAYGNNVSNGHNLLPEYSARKFYYFVSKTTNPTDARASFPSFAFHLFQTDPLLHQPSGPI